MMTQHATLYIILFAAAFLVLVMEPLREGLLKFLKWSWKPALDWTKVALHFLIGAHLNVLRNFQPRQKLLYELERKRTSHTRGD